MQPKAGGGPAAWAGGEEAIYFDHVSLHPTKKRRFTMTTPRISVIVGSLRRESFARKIAHEVLTMIPEGYEANIVENP